MLFAAKDIIGCAIDAADGQVGRVKDIDFDDSTWAVRYLVVDTGGWLSRQEVLLVPSCLTGGDPVSGILTTNLTCQQVKDSPPISADRPLSRQYEEQLHEYYGWMPYWDLPLYASPGLFVYPPLGGLTPSFSSEVGGRGNLSDDLGDDESVSRHYGNLGDPHLRNLLEIKGYDLEAVDGRVGHVADCLISSLGWRVTHLVVDLNNWLPSKKIVLDAAVVESMSWGDSKVAVEMTCAEVRAAPGYDGTRLGESRYLAALMEYFQGLSMGSRRLRPSVQSLPG